MLRDIGEIQKLATKYSKPQLARMAQMGLIDPTKAVMAGMMIDRITKSNMQSPQRTVADEALGQTPMPMPMPDQQQMQPAQAGMGGLPPQQAPNAGVAALPSGITEMAGGGIVAFDDGGEVQGYAGDEGSFVRPSLFGSMAPPNQAESENTLRLINEASQRPSPIAELFRSVEAGRQENISQYNQRLQAIRQKMAAGIALDPAEQTLARYNNLTPASAPAPAATPAPEATPAPAPVATPAARPDTRQAPPAARRPRAEAPPPPTGIESIAPTGVPKLVMDPNIGKFTTESYKMPDKKEIKDVLREQQEADKLAGVNTNIYKDLMGELEGKRGKLASRKQEAIGMAIMQTGLGLIGARRGQEFAALGEAGQRGLQGLVNANEKIRETEEKIDDSRRGLLMAENDYKRTRSDKAYDAVQRNKDKIEALEIKNVDNKNDANKRMAEIDVQKLGQQVSLRGQDVTEAGNILQSKTTLEAERMRNRQSEINARISAAAQNRPGESERLMAQYENIQKTQGQEAANAWLSNLERVRGAGKPQNTFSYEEALKIVAAQTGNIRATPQELARQARELVEASKPQPGGISRPGGSVDTSNPLLQGG